MKSLFCVLVLAVALTCVFGAEVQAEAGGVVVPKLVDSIDLGALKPVPKTFKVKPIILVVPGKPAQYLTYCLQLQFTRYIVLCVSIVKFFFFAASLWAAFGLFWFIVGGVLLAVAGAVWVSWASVAV